MRLFFWIRRAHISNCRISTSNKAAKGHIAQNAVNINWMPQGSRNRLPDCSHKLSRFLTNLYGTHHKAGPRIRNCHQDNTPNIEQHPQPNMRPFVFFHRVPKIIIKIKGKRLAKKDQRVDIEHIMEDLRHISHKSRIKPKQRKGQKAPQRCRR